MIEIEMPGGHVIEFPDGTPQDTIQQAVTSFKPEISLGQALTSAVQPGTLKKSGLQLAKDTLQPLLHPINTYEGLKNLGAGVMQKFEPGVQEEEKYADAAGAFLKDRFGGWNNIKNTIATDPLGAAADASMLLTGGGSLAARAPGALGKAGRIAGVAGKAIDPIRAAGKVAGEAAAIPLGFTSGMGREAVRESASAGARGASFVENMRGAVPTQEVVQDAMSGVAGLKQSMQDTYLANKKNWAAANKAIDWDPVNKSLENIGDVRTFRGMSGQAKMQVLDDAAEKARQTALKVVNDWQMLDPGEFHTTLGLDALKQKIGKLLDNTPYEQRSARKVYGEVYHSLRDQLVKQSPSYAMAMKQYEAASDLVREMEQTLSLKPGARIDASLRKLQSILRNNANTNYGRRVELGKMLEDAGATHLAAKLAGQSASAILPRALSGQLTGAGVAAGGYGGGIAALLSPKLWLGAAATSPRAVGEAGHFYGNYGYPTGLGLWNAGRLTEDQ